MFLGRYFYKATQRATSFLICLALIIGVFSASGTFKAANADYVPTFDPKLGSYSVSGDVITATPNENCGFRGWYDKSTGKEVAVTRAFTLPSGTSAEDYVPVFYNRNLLSESDFEAFSVGTNLKQMSFDGDVWDGCTDDSSINGESGDWTKMVVDDSRSHSGSKSAKIVARNNAFFRTVTGLNKNAQYKFSFYYNLDSTTTSPTGVVDVPYMWFVGAVPKGSVVLPRSIPSKTNLGGQFFTKESGSCADGVWNKVEFVFYTNSNTDVELCIQFWCENEASLYIDDLVLVNVEAAGPSYVNNDFSTDYTYGNYSSGYHANWTLSDSDALKFNIADGQLVTTEPKGNYKFVQSPCFHVKKGYTYKVSYNIDLSKVTYEHVQVFDSKTGEYVTDESGNPVYEVNATTGNYNSNWINFSFSNKFRAYGSSSDGTTLLYNEDGSTCFTAKVYNKGKESDGYTYKKASSAFGFSKSGIKEASKKGILFWVSYGIDPNLPLYVDITFTAAESGPAYFNCRLNGRGTYSLDDFSVTETASNLVVEDIIKNNLNFCGVAIRTTGKQGIRYKTAVSRLLLDADMPLGVRVTEYGTVALRTERLNGEELVIDKSYTSALGTYPSVVGKAYVYDATGVNSCDVRYAEDDNAIYYTGVLMNIGKKYYTSDYTVRAYVKYVDKNGNEGILYADDSQVDVYQVSKTAYSARNANGDFVETSAVRRYLLDNIISLYTDKKITVDNAAPCINDNFQGISSTIYHATTFFSDSHGRTYTEEQAAVEMDRLVDSKVNNVRTRLASQWMWTADGWNWESAKMQAIYKWGKMLQDRDISITIQAGWHLEDFIHYYDYHKNGGEKFGTEHTSIPEVDYLHGVGASLYGEDSMATRIAAYPGLDDLDANELAHYSLTAARYGEWIKQSLNALKAHGVYNVKYVIPFTETGYLLEGDPIHSYAEWLIMTLGLHGTLKEAGIRGDYKFIGPSQSIYAYQNREVPFVEYVYDKIKGTSVSDMLDINSMHQYTSPNTRKGYANTVYDPYGSYSLADENFNYYQDVLANAGVQDMEFWCDEYFAHAPDAKWWHNVGMQMVQFAAGLTVGINTGVDRFLTWQMFDCLWDSTATHGLADIENSGEFIGGVHAVGTCPSLIKVDGKTCATANCPCKNYTHSSYVPRVTYYGINLLGKHMNNCDAEVFSTNVLNDMGNEEGGIYASAIRSDAGNMVILVVNTENTVAPVSISFTKDNMKYPFARYVYDYNEIVPDEKATSIPSNGTVRLANGLFKDNIPARSFAIYVEESPKTEVEVDVSGI